jgi:hypothetical protein
MTQLINQEVNVNSFYFASGASMKTFPRQIEWNGRPVTFAETGLRYLVKRGEQLVRLFDMNEGDTTYRLRQEDDRWTLVGTKVAA